jgi:GMP synthase (glutamine-hydrolysing)
MTKTRDALQLVLLQIRQEQRVREEEHHSFCTYAGLEPHQVSVHNVFDQPDFSDAILADCDALLVGGASEASVLEPERYPFVPASIRLMQRCIERDVPVFASCFGFQLAVLALGGRIVRDQRDFEVGCVPISLTPEAADDRLFQGVPDGFHAVAVHRERAPQCPEGVIPLAFTEQCLHAFKVRERRFWAFQFHPEVDRQTLVERLTIFQEHYTDDGGHLQRVLESAVETPHSNNLVSHFVDRVLLSAN